MKSDSSDKSSETEHLEEAAKKHATKVVFADQVGHFEKEEMPQQGFHAQDVTDGSFAKQETAQDFHGKQPMDGGFKTQETAQGFEQQTLDGTFHTGGSEQGFQGQPVTGKFKAQETAQGFHEQIQPADDVQASEAEPKEKPADDVQASEAEPKEKPADEAASDAKAAQASEADSKEQASDVTEKADQKAAAATTERLTPAADDAGAKKEKKKRRKWPILVFLLALALFAAAAAIGIPRYLEAQKREEYRAAQALLSSGDFEGAKVAFGAMEGYRDAAEKVALSEKNINYQRAMELFEKGNYPEALKIFTELGDFEDSAAKARLCEYIPKYDTAKALMEKKNWSEATAILSELASVEYEDSKALLAECQNSMAYEAAQKLLDEGRFYDAYKAFLELGGYSDAAAKAESCIQPKPGNGEIARDPGYAGQDIDIIIDNTADPTDSIYLKMYVGETVALRAFIPAGAELTLKVPAATYTIKEAMGSGNWYGETDMFGDEGAYGIVNGGPINIEEGYEYTLGTSPEGSGATQVGREGF